MAYTTTTRLELQKAVPGSAQVFETTVINDNWDAIDAEAVAIDGRLDAAESDIATLQSQIAAPAAVTTVSGTTYTILATDANDMLRFTSSADVTVTVNDVLAIGEYINCIQDNTGKIIFSAGAGVTIQSPVGASARSSIQYGWVSIIKLASGVYRLVGSLEANA